MTNLLNYPLYSFQKEGIKFLLKVKRAILAWDMGVGKTPTAIATLKLLKDNNYIDRCIIICPSSIKDQWVREINKFVNGFTISLIEGNKEKRKTLYQNPSFIKILNYELLLRDINELSSILSDSTVLILDEVSRVKNYKTKLSQNLKWLLYNSKSYLAWIWGLSGTPLENRLEELFNIIKIICPYVFKEKFSEFRDKYIILKDLWIYTKGGRRLIKVVDSYKNLDDFRERVKPYMQRVKKSDVLNELPPKIYNNIYCELTKNQQKLYNAILEKDENLRRLLTEFVKGQNDEQNDKRLMYIFNQLHSLANFTYLRELCDSSELVCSYMKDSSKLEELISVLGDLLNGKRKVCVFTQFERMAGIIKRELALHNIKSTIISGKIPINERQGIIDKFKLSKEINVMIMTKVLAFGINLEFSDVLIFFDHLFNPAINTQIEDRLHRIGQKGVVNIIRIWTKDTVEDKVQKIILDKEYLFKEIIDKL